MEIAAMENTAILTQHLETDLLLVAKWAKEELFKTCKFLYRGKEDLEQKGLVYEQFEKECMDSLPGVIAAKNIGDEYQQVYVKMVWDEARERHTLSTALSLRRSCVYTVMQNRFNDLVNECVLNKLIFPALEAFEERLANPTNYYLFYEYFLRAAVGEEEWKRNSGFHHKTSKKRKSAPRTPTDERPPSKRMASSLDEAFALIVLKNNYFAWLLEAKQQSSGLLTDYDSARSGVTPASTTLVQYLLNGSLVCLNWEESESYILWKPPNCEIITDFHDVFVEETNKLKAEVQRIREKARQSQEYKRVVEALKQIRTTNNGEDEKGRKQKKRKIIRDLKPYTGGRLGDEESFRGWSGRAFVEMFELKKAIKGEKDQYKRFGKAYRHLYAVQRKETAVSVPGGQADQELSKKPGLDDEQYRQLFDVRDDTSDDEDDQE